jgi:hypothetical protein
LDPSERGFKILTEPTSAPMQQNPLIDLRDFQYLTDLLAIKSLNISKRYDLALTFGKVLERRTDTL